MVVFFPFGSKLNVESGTVVWQRWLILDNQLVISVFSGIWFVVFVVDGRVSEKMAENDIDLYADDIDQDFAQVST